MKRTTIVLTDKLLRQLKKIAERRNVSVAAVVREAMATYVVQLAGGSRVPSVAGRGASGRTDAAEKVDELLWKDPHA